MKFFVVFFFALLATVSSIKLSRDFFSYYPPYRRGMKVEGTPCDTNPYYKGGGGWRGVYKDCEDLYKL